LPVEDFLFSAGGGFLFGAVSGYAKLSINLFIYESRPDHEKIEDVLFMQIHILNLSRKS